MINKKRGNIAVAVAIVLAGAIIALAIIFTNGSKTTVQDDKLTGQLLAYAETVGLDQKDFRQCLEEERYADKIQSDYKNGVDTGGRGTPHSVIIGPNDIKLPLSGALPLENWQEVINLILENPEEILSQLPTDQENPALNVAPITEADWFYGNRDAVITIVEYSDTECPFCAVLHLTLKKLVDESDGQIAWVYRHFPIIQLHPEAPFISNAVECAGELGGNDKFWSYLDLVYEKQKERR